MSKRLDFASGYFTVFPWDYKNPKANRNEPYFFISKSCPEEVKKKLLVEWELEKEETIDRQRKGIYLSTDLFLSTDFGIDLLK